MADPTCRTCRSTKPEVEFYIGRHGKPYLDCKRCHNLVVVAQRRDRLARQALIAQTLQQP
jgi:transposase